MKGHDIEPHSGFFFLHLLPHRQVCRGLFMFDPPADRRQRYNLLNIYFNTSINNYTWKKKRALTDTAYGKFQMSGPISLLSTMLSLNA